ncbi:MAG: winged helix-turn-helix transcriptional regulator [Oscillospiraceae bacterium]|nr:winged helix-turn-helix transcriptional regulator [Oscillospiraceae bacterium]
MNDRDTKLKIRKYLSRREEDISKLDAVAFVTKCKSVIDITELQNVLQGELGKLKLLLANHAEAELIRSFVKTVHRGLLHASESMEAEQYYWYGHYVALMQAVLGSSHQETKDNTLFVEMTARTAFAPIMRHLYEVGACQHKVLADVLHMNKSNLTKEMDRLVASGLVNKIKGGKFVHYELTQQGYTLMNKYYQISPKHHTHNAVVQNQYVLEVPRQVRHNISRQPIDTEAFFDYSSYSFSQKELRNQLRIVDSVKEENNVPQPLLEVTKDYCDFEELSIEKYPVKRSATYVH